jgi:purine-binding chemotaxis protein CheW
VLDDDLDEDLSPQPAAADSLERTIDRMVIFRLGTQAYALPISRVQEIQQLVAVIQLPDTYRALVGLVNLRGEVVPAIDFRLLVGMPSRPYSLQTPMVIVRSGEQLVALIVDQVDDVVVLPDDCLQPPARLYALADKMIGMCRLRDELVYLLDIEALVPPADIAGIKSVAGEGIAL